MRTGDRVSCSLLASNMRNEAHLAGDQEKKKKMKKYDTCANYMRTSQHRNAKKNYLLVVQCHIVAAINS